MRLQVLHWRRQSKSQGLKRKRICVKSSLKMLVSTLQLPFSCFVPLSFLYASNWIYVPLEANETCFLNFSQVKKVWVRHLIHFEWIKCKFSEQINFNWMICVHISWTNNMQISWTNFHWNKNSSSRIRPARLKSFFSV